MKNNNFKIAAAFILLMVSGCKDYLNVSQENQPETKGIDYSKSDNMNQPIFGLYADLYKVGWPVFPLLSVLGDDVNAGGLGDQGPFADTDKFVYDAGYWMYNAIWNDLLGRVFTSNSVIDQTLKYKELASNKALADQYIAEAKVIRAYMLYQLTRLWGPVFIPMTLAPEDLYNAKISTQEEVLKHIVAEMDDAAAKLPDAHPNARSDLKGGVTKHTALAIKAMANLMLKNYQGVADATSQIIASGKFSLEPDFYELFNKKGQLNNENLFELQGANINDYTIWWFQFYGPQDWVPEVAESGGGWGFWEPSYKYVKFMLERQETVRLETSVIFTPSGIKKLKDDKVVLPTWITEKETTVTAGKETKPAYKNRYGDSFIDFPREIYLSGKHYLPSRQLEGQTKSYGANKNFVIIRYAEILLMHAEALMRGANSSGMTALQAVNAIRNRAKIPELSAVTADDVIAEKYAEMAMELGIRYTDMTRLEKYDELSYDGRTFTAKKIHLPYPQGQVDLLPILKTTKNN